MKKFCLKIVFGLFLTIFISAFWSKNIAFANTTYCDCTYDGAEEGKKHCTVASSCSPWPLYCKGNTIYYDEKCEVTTPPAEPTHYALLYNPTTKDGECQAVVGRDCSGYVNKPGYRLNGCFTKIEDCQKKLDELKNAGSDRWCKCTENRGERGRVECVKADATGKCPSPGSTFTCSAPTYINPSCTSDEPVVPPAPLDTSLEFKELKLEDLSKINPLRGSETFGDESSRTLGNIVSVLLTMIVFPLAGLILFLMIVWGGYQILNGSLTGNQSKIDLGKNKITYAIYGFLLLFASWWLWSMIEIAIGINKS